MSRSVSPRLAATPILFLNNFSGPGLGGGEVQLLNVIRACVEAGMDVTVACPPRTELVPATTEAGARAVEVSFVPRQAAATVRKVRELAIDTEASIVHGSGYFTNLIARMAAPEPALAVSLVQVEPGASVYDGGSRLGVAARGLAERATRSRSDAYVAVSDSVARALTASGIPAQAVHTIRIGISAPSVREAARAPCSDIPVVRPLVLCAARLEPVKGVEYFVRAAAKIARVHPHAHFAITGVGPLEGRLREIAVSEGVHERLEFLGYVRPSAAPVVAAADVLVVPSLSEGLPIAPLEAMALGKPVVATNVGGLPEVVQHGATGLLVPPADPPALTRAVGALLADPPRARTMGEAGRRRVESDFSIERMTESYLALYAELLGA